jgi:hypothetical protein
VSPVQINLLNIALMFLSAAFAFAVPFETFLVAYAVLGPLHYLTQISWLHERGWFTARRRDAWLLLGLTAVIVALNLAALSSPALLHLGYWAVDLLFFALGLAFLLAFTGDLALRLAGAAVLAFAFVLIHGSPGMALWIGLLVPTLIHVFVFTGAFVLHGALRSRSWSGHASFLVLIACAAATLSVEPGSLGYAASDYAKQVYQLFWQMHVGLLRILGVGGDGVPQAGNQWFPLSSYGEIFTTPVSIRAGRFIAFAYTYHYLNWFSKTSVIRWHEIPRRRMAGIVALWLASIALYALDYGIGLRWLLFLSFAHLLLEFPLDHKTFVGIGRELMARIRPAASR